MTTLLDIKNLNKSFNGHQVVEKPPYCVVLLVLNNQQAVRFG